MRGVLRKIKRARNGHILREGVEIGHTVNKSEKYVK